MLVEKAVSNRSKCKNCNNQIREGELRCKLESQGYMYKSHTTLCRKCGIAHLRRMIGECYEQLKILGEGTDDL